MKKFLLVALVGLAACSGSPDRSEVVSAVTGEALLPGIDQAVTALADLDAAVNAFCADPSEPDLPDFVDHSEIELSAYWDPEKEGTIVGRLMGAITVTTRNRPRLVYGVKVAKTTIAVTGKGRDRKETKLAAGQIIGVGERHQLRRLAEYVDSKPMVRITALEKVPVGEDQTMWRMRLEIEAGAKGHAPRRALPPPPSDDDSDIPF